MNRAQRRAAARAVRRRGARAGRSPANPVDLALAAVRPLTSEQRDHLAIRNHGALAALAQGSGQPADAVTLASMANVTLVLVELVDKDFTTDEQRRLADAALALVKAAQGALLQLEQRFEETGRYAFEGGELVAVNDCLELHDQFIAQADQGLIERAARLAVKRCRAGLAARTVAELQDAA